MKVLSKKQIFSQYKETEFDHGLTISNILDELDYPVEVRDYVDVRINGYKIFPKTWDKCRPNKDSVTTIALVPAGGGPDNQTLNTIATIGLVAAGGAAGVSLFGTKTFGARLASGLFTGGVTLLGSQLVNSMFPPPEPPSLNGFGVSRLPTVTGQSNRSDPYGPVIRNYGRNRVYPRVVAEPFIHYVGNDQYLSAVYDFGIGENNLELANIRIGESSIVDFTGVAYNITENPNNFNIYKNAIDIESFSLPFNNPGDNYIRTSPEDTHTIELEFNFPNGLRAIIGRKRISVALEQRLSIRLRPSGTTQWTDYTTYDYDLTTGLRDFNYEEQTIRLVAQGTILSQYLVIPSTFTTRRVDQYRIDYDSDIIVYRLNNDLVNSKPLEVGDSVDLIGTSNGPRGLRRARVVEVLSNINANTYRARIDTRLTFSSVVNDGNGVPNLPPGFTFEYELNINSRSGTQDFVIKKNTSSQFRANVTINTGIPSRWDVWVKLEDQIVERLGSNPVYVDGFFWNNIVGYSSASPVATQIPHTYLELKIKATDQLNGVIDNLSADIISVLDYYDDVNQVWKKKQTSNPAWVFADILTGDINQRAISKDDLDVDSLVAWAKYCETNTITYQGNTIGFECNFVLDFETTVKKLLEQVCSVGRATLNINNGKYGVVIDEFKSTPTQMFNERNILSFNSQRNYSPVPDGVKCIFIDPASSWQKNEVIAYNDGFNSSNAEIIEEIEIFACTNIAQAWRQGRYFLAKQKLRQDNVTITTDFEHLVCSRGDLVNFSHDVMKNGGQPARVVSINGNEVGLDIGVVSLGGNEVLRARKRLTNEIDDIPVLSIIDSNTLELDNVADLQVNDLVIYGELGVVTENYIVKSITSLDDLGATIELVEYNEGIYTADQDVIPDYSANTVPSPLTGGDYPGSVSDLTATYSVDCHLSEKRYIYEVALNWTPPNVGKVDLYEIYVQISGEQKLVGYSKNSTYIYEVNGLQLGESHIFKVVGLDANGNKAPLGLAPSVTVIPSDDTVRPENVQNFNANVLTETIALDWQLTNDCDIDRYFIRFSPKTSGAAWGQSTLVTSTGPTQNVTNVPLRTGTYLIKAQDWAGNLSESANLVVTQVPELANIEFISEINAPVFDGVFEDTDTFGNSITLRSNDGLSTFINDEGNFVFREVFDLGDVFTARFESNVIASGFTRGSLMVNWPTLASISSIAGDFSEDDWDVFIYIRTRNISEAMSSWATLSEVDYLSFGSELTATPWQKFTNADFTGRIFQLRVGLESSFNDVSPIVDSVNIIANWSERIEQERDEISGNPVTFSYAFNEIPVIQITSQENIQQGDYYQITSKTVAGFTVQFYDVNNNAVFDRKYDWIAKGYGKKYNLTDINF